MGMETTYYPDYSAWATANPRADAMLRAPAPFDMGYTGSRGVATSRLAGFNATLQSTRLGRAALGGVAESVGFYVPGMTDQPVGSFLGVSETLGEMGLSTDRFKRQASAVYKGTRGLVSRGRFVQAGRYLGKQGMRGIAGAGGAKAAASFAGKTFMKSIPLIGTAVFAYQGYQEEGVWGAMKGVGESMMWSAGFRMAGSLITNPFTLTAAGVAAVGYGVYALGEAGRAHAKRLKDTEFVAKGAIDALGSVGAATNRQRSMMALNNTHLNGRMAMGNEGILMHGDMTTGMRGFR